MVNLDSRGEEIKVLVDRGKYFTINRARQYAVRRHIIINMIDDMFSQ